MYVLILENLTKRTSLATLLWLIKLWWVFCMLCLSDVTSGSPLLKDCLAFYGDDGTMEAMERLSPLWVAHHMIMIINTDDGDHSEWLNAIGIANTICVCLYGRNDAKLIEENLHSSVIFRVPETEWHWPHKIGFRGENSKCCILF